MLVVAALGVGCATQALTQAPAGQAPQSQEKSPERKDKVVLTDAEWKKKLTPLQYGILRHAETERAFTGRLYNNHYKGVYYCAGCGLKLFDSDDKFESGTGWPSFVKPATKDAVWTRTDLSDDMVRQEVLCARCDGHLGHVFDDGPADRGGLRYCMNSGAMTFKTLAQVKASKDQ